MFTSVSTTRSRMISTLVFTCAILALLWTTSATMAANNRNVALDANGGSGSPYLNDKVAPNDNLLWKIVKYGDYVRIIPKVNQKTALDANGGVGVPYLNPNLAENDNLLWKLKTQGEYVMIVPKVNQKVALDANGGRDNPYLSDKPDANNVNQLWQVVKEENSDFYRIYSKLEKKAK
ncbi:hypothetical protein U14_04471 [Candidatus Moduliflexus flocculans]|uniref:Ricin B lectin domain-containing protein n=1 Tax=Candidatus Moduliflexus flocculans TaxID=1499966 RepID=A0A0S6W0K1_9BACT|nr:hypothetical protein U14_04471 [Candidatus Moduliflexus flocculans]